MVEDDALEIAQLLAGRTWQTHDGHACRNAYYGGEAVIRWLQDCGECARHRWKRSSRPPGRAAVADQLSAVGTA